MKHEKLLGHEFVEFIPKDIKDGMIYISIPYATAVHKCCCGCGSEVVTPLSPKGWTLIFDGETISLDPSIGNWNYSCRSHYWIRRNRVHWVPKWAEQRIEPSNYRTGDEYVASQKQVTDIVRSVKSNPKRTLWHRLMKWISAKRRNDDYDQNL